MRALNYSGFLLLHLHTEIPISNYAYLSSSSSSFRQARGRGRRNGVAYSSASSSSSSFGIRKPCDRISTYGNELVSSSPSSSSREVEVFLELVPLRMRKELFEHNEILDLIELVLDLGRKPIARFPSGDWIISQQPVTPQDLRHAISKVTQPI